MSKKVVPLPEQRLRSVSEERLVERPLQHRQLRLTRLRYRKRAGLLVWLIAFCIVAALFLSGGS
jgi:hypothetical protein